MGNDDSMVPGPLAPIDHIATVIAALERAASPGEMWTHRKTWAQRLRLAAGLMQPVTIPNRPTGAVRIIPDPHSTFPPADNDPFIGSHGPPIENPAVHYAPAFTTRAVSMEAICATTIGQPEETCARCGGKCPNRQL